MAEPRGLLPPDVEKAARTVSRAAWGSPYVVGQGVMHFGGGPAHAATLRAKADKWERLAAAARICADWLGDGEFPAAPPAPATIARIPTPHGKAHLNGLPCHEPAWCPQVHIETPTAVAAQDGREKP